MKSKFWYLEKQGAEWSTKRPKTFIGMAVMNPDYEYGEDFETMYIGYYSIWFNKPIRKEVFFYQNIIDLE